MENENQLPKFDINNIMNQIQNQNKNGEDDILEMLKLTKDDAHLYKIPPMSSSEGHTTDEFKELIFRGKMKMFFKGDFVIIYFLNANNTVFMVSFVQEDIDKFVTRARDSTRYFSLKGINEKGEGGYYGLGSFFFSLLHLLFFFLYLIFFLDFFSFDNYLFTFLL
jgi:hypothetical protein